MTLSTRYAVASQDIVAESFDGDYVVLDLSCGKYFSFSDSANIIWEAMSAGVSPAELLRSNIAISPTELESFVNTLTGHGLILAEKTALPSNAARASDYIDRLVVTVEKPDVAVFDDLADLFKADPIHDVEEPAGWPAVRQA